MNREFVLSVLYDLTLTIGGEVDSQQLLRKTLQRLLYHTAFPVGIVIGEVSQDGRGDSARLEMAIGDHALAEHCGNPLTLARGVLAGKVELITDPATLLPFSLERNYSVCLRLPVDTQCTILLLSPEAPASTLPLTQVFQPVLANLSKAIDLCRSNERLTQSLASSRDDARADLAVALARSEQERAFLDCLNETIPDLLWVKDPDGVYLSCNPSFARLYGDIAGNVVGRTDADFVTRELADFFREKDRAAVLAGQSTINEEWLTFADNGYRGLFETIKTPMRDKEGKLIGVLGIARDITERKRVQE